MHSVDGSGSPRKRTISRGMSEDESLRSIIKEADSSSRRLIRSESRTGSLRKRTDSQQSDQDLLMGLPDMLELQASYDEVVQELRGLEVEREALLFQVDVLQDSLEGVEELLAEAQREAGQASLELEQEREARRKMERLVSSLLQEVERLKEERNNKALVTMMNELPLNNVPSEVNKDEQKEKGDSTLCGPHGQDVLDGGPTQEGEGGVMMKLKRMVNLPLGQIPSLSLDNVVSIDGVLRRPYQNHASEDEWDCSPDRNDSDKSAYEDASAETPEQDKLFPGDGELPHDVEKNTENGQTQEPQNPEACILS
uniref:Leucine rich repeat (In FLII) interacting protein 1b n=1 Tax=Iconisemion striatum TaxID=60296 RepID=A0A1A7W813_9TELE